MTLEQAKSDWNNFKATEEELEKIQDGLMFTIARLSMRYFDPVKQPKEYTEIYEFIESRLRLSTQPQDK